MVYLDANHRSTGAFFKNTSKLAIWSTIEPGVGIVAASAATLRRLFQHLFKTTTLFGAQTRRRSSAITPNTINCTTTIMQERTDMNGNMVRIISDTTTLQIQEQPRVRVLERKKAWLRRCAPMVWMISRSVPHSMNVIWKSITKLRRRCVRVVSWFVISEHLQDLILLLCAQRPVRKACGAQMTVKAQVVPHVRKSWKEQTLLRRE